MRNIYSKSVLLLLLLAATVFSSCENDDDSQSPAIVQEDIAAIDNQVAAYMATYKVPGASLAISKDGKLVYRKAYGFADESTKEAVTVNHRFRVASISKTITSVAVLKLIEEGKLTLDQTVFGPTGILGTTYGTKAYSANLSKITVRDLLQHTSGGWRNFVDDPAFSQPSLTADELIAWGLDNVPLAYTPGTRYHYSNFGYLILGRIIEKVSGKTYEDHVKSSLLNPLGATNTEIAGDNEADKKTDEVNYYSQNSESPYTSYAITRNDAPMGWISTPTDLLRLMTAVDSTNTRPDILNGQSLATFSTPASFTANHAKGIFYYKDPQAGPVWFVYGSLPGTHTFAFRAKSGYTVAFLTNTRFDANYQGSSDAMSDMLLQIINDNSIPWQAIDQFE